MSMWKNDIYKKSIHVLFPLKNLAHKGLTYHLGVYLMMKAIAAAGVVVTVYSQKLPCYDNSTW